MKKTFFIINLLIVSFVVLFRSTINNNKVDSYYVINPTETQNSFNNNPIILPIEVLGEVGTESEPISFDISSTTLNNATELFFMVNNLGYEDKGAIKINNGNWISLNHTTVNLYPSELARGGMQHGGYNTIRFTMPVDDLITGSNSLQFQFTKGDGISIGYRVIRFNILDSSGNTLLDDSLFEEDNPETWEGPYTDQASIAEGKDLWENAELWNHYLSDSEEGSWYGQSLPKRKIIRAKCASCHTQDGRDLEYFSYSNHSIIERSKFHNLTEEEGKKIASYIRSLSESKANVDRYGRPWNPPYQPGPSIENKPIEQWAAGAGIDAVLDKDEDMLEYLFPNGATQETVRDLFDSDKMMDRTTIPIAIQFPDWKHWLPMIHPLDAFDVEDITTISSQDPLQKIQDVSAYFEENRTRFEANGHTENDDFTGELVGLQGSFRTFFEQGSPNPRHWRTRGGDAENSLTEGATIEFVKTSMARLLAVKSFEFINEFNLQDKTYLIVNSEDQPGERQWPSKRVSVFEIPAHFTGNVTINYEGQPRETGRFESTNWYTLQMLLNGGNGMIAGTQPMDFNYHTPHIGMAAKDATNAGNIGNFNESLRYYTTLSQIYQIRSWSGNRDEGPYGPSSPSNDNIRGFRMRHQGPFHFLGMADNGRIYFKDNQLEESEYMKILPLQLDNAQQGLSTLIIEALILQFNIEMERPENQLYNEDGTIKWPRVSPNGSADALDPLDKTTSDIIPLGDIFGNTNRHADRMYGSIPIFKDLGVDCSVLNPLVEWCKEAWPDIDFETFLEEDCNTLSIDDVTTNNFIDNKIILYPNPTSNHLSIIINEEIDPAEIIIYDLLGRIQSSKSFGNQNFVNIDVSHLKTGQYIVKVIATNNSYNSSFIKN